MTRGRYRSLQSYNSSQERHRGREGEREKEWKTGKMENEIIFMHMMQEDPAFMSRD